MSILPCKNCGHTFWAHAEGIWKGCLDCKPGERCKNFEDVPARPLAPVPGRTAETEKQR
jgi:predicted  nucleic acid-binding Zn-ribbon protein